MNEKNPLNIEIKKINRSNIYHEFLANDTLTKQNLVSNLQLCLPTVSKNIDELTADGLIEKSGSRGHTGGRRAVTYALIKDARIAIGIDVTQNHITLVAVNLMGTIISSVRKRIRFEPTDSYYRYVGESLTEFAAKLNLDQTHILGVGIGLPSLVDADRKSVFFSKIIELGNTTLDDFAKYIPYKIELFNDANAAAFTEIWMKPETQNIFYLMLCNNIGGSMILNGSIYSGDSQKSAEVGHITLVPGGRKCYCGQSGCVDAYLAATNLSDLSEGSLQLFFEKLKNGCESCSQAWNIYLDYLAQTVNHIHILLDCSIILGGYVGEYLEPYLGELRTRAARLDTFQSNGDYLKICSYKKEAIAAGAALNFISSFIETV